MIKHHGERVVKFSVVSSDEEYRTSLIQVETRFQVADVLEPIISTPMLARAGWTSVTSPVDQESYLFHRSSNKYVPLIAVNDGWYIDVKISSSPSDRCRRLHPVDVVGDDVMEGDELESSAQPSSLHSSSASSSSSSSAKRQSSSLHSSESEAVQSGARGSSVGRPSSSSSSFIPKRGFF